MFAEREAPLLLPAPDEPFVIPVFSHPKIARDRHVEVTGLPRLVGLLDARVVIIALGVRVQTGARRHDKRQARDDDRRQLHPCSEPLPPRRAGDFVVRSKITKYWGYSQPKPQHLRATGEILRDNADRLGLRLQDLVAQSKVARDEAEAVCGANHGAGHVGVAVAVRRVGV